MAPDDAESEFREKFRLEDLTVVESADWTLSVRPAQPVLGSLVLSTRRGALHFSALPSESGRGMLQLMARAETAARQLFGAVRVNALCLMMQDPLFHFHLLPRYSGPIDFARTRWADSGWPGPPTLADNQAAGDRELLQIRAAYAELPWE